jgi:hypothetical protein
MVMLREFYNGFEGKLVQILNKKIEKNLLLLFCV